MSVESFEDLNFPDDVLEKLKPIERKFKMLVDHLDSKGEKRKSWNEERSQTYGFHDEPD